MAPNKEVSMGFTGKTFPPGTQMCYIYNDEDERSWVLFRFLESGLLNGEKVLYLMDTNTSDEMRERQVSLGIDKLQKENQGQLCVAAAKETYCPSGIFDPDEMLYKLTEFYAQSVDEGCTGVWATGEMTWVTKGLPGSSRLVEYEARLNSTFMKCPITEICQYNLKRFDNSILRDVLTVHPMVIFKGRILKNPYYIKSWWLLKRYLGLKEDKNTNCSHHLPRHGIGARLRRN